MAALEFGELHVCGTFKFNQYFMSVRGSEVFDFCDEYFG